MTAPSRPRGDEAVADVGQVADLSTEGHVACVVDDDTDANTIEVHLATADCTHVAIPVEQYRRIFGGEP